MMEVLNLKKVGSLIAMQQITCIRSDRASHTTVDVTEDCDGKNSTSRVQEVGNIHIKTHDRTARTLENVKHVLQLQRNLIS